MPVLLLLSLFVGKPADIEVSVLSFHDPRLEMFLDQAPLQNTPTELEPIRPPIWSDLDMRKEILYRQDMQLRDVDEIKSKHSIFACLSKTLFGTEIYETYVQEFVLKEIGNNPEYRNFLFDGPDSTSGASGQLSSATGLTGLGDIALIAAATCLQVICITLFPLAVVLWLNMRVRPFIREHPFNLRGGGGSKYMLSFRGADIFFLPKQCVLSQQLASAFSIFFLSISETSNLLTENVFPQNTIAPPQVKWMVPKQNLLVCNTTLMLVYN